MNIKRIMFLFMLVFVFASVSYADYQYNIVVYPGPGTTTILFTDPSTYDIQYDNNYNITMQLPGVIEITLYNPLNVSVSEVVELDLSKYVNVSSINFSTIYFVDEYGNPLYFYYENSVVYFNVNDVQPLSNYTVYMFYNVTNKYHELYYKSDLVHVNMTIDFDDDTYVNDFIATNGASILGLTTYNNEPVLQVHTTNYPQAVYYDLKLDTSKPFYVEVKLYTSTVYVGAGLVYNDTSYYFLRPSIVLAKVVNGAIETSDYITTTVTAPYNITFEIITNTVNGYCNNLALQIIDNNKFEYVYSGVASWYSGDADYYIVYIKINAYKYLEHYLNITSVHKIYDPVVMNNVLTNNNGLYAVMGIRYKSWFGLCNSASCPARIVYDTGFTFYVGTEYYGGGDIGYDGDYFLYQILYDGTWHFSIDDFYTSQYLYKDTGDTSVFTGINETYITRPYLFYIVFAPYDSNYVIVHIRAPPNYYVDNVTVQYMYAYYQNQNVYIYYQGNDAYIKLGYTNQYTSYYPFIVRFNLYVGDLPERNTYDATSDPYSDSPPPVSSSSSSDTNTVWGYSPPSGTAFNGTLSIPGGALFPQFLLNTMLFIAILLPNVLLYRRYWFFPVMLGLLVLSRVGYTFFYVPIVLFTIFATMMFLREYIAEEYSLLIGLVMGYFMNIFIVSGNTETAPTPPSNPLDIPGYLNDLLVKAITFSYLPYPFSFVMTIFFMSLVVFAVIRLVIRIVRGV